MYLFEKLCLFQEGNMKNIKKHATGGCVHVLYNNYLDASYEKIQ